MLLLLAACAPAATPTEEAAGDETSEPTAETEATEEESEATEAPEAEETEEAASSEPVELTLTIWGSQTDQEIYQQRLDAFHEVNPNITVNLEYIPSDYDQKVQTMIAGGTAPDIMLTSEAVHVFSSSEQIIPLNDLLEQHGVSVEERFGPALTDIYTRDGSIYALPDRGGAMVVYYNKDAFDAAGVEYPSADWTWDDMLEAAQALTIVDENGEVVQYGFAAGGWWPWWMSFIYQNGGQILDENGQPTVNTPEVIEALQFYNDLVYVHEVAPSPEDYANLGFTSPDPLFAQGKVAFQITGMWNIASLKEVPDLNWDIAPLWHDDEPGTVMFGSALAITKDCADYDACFAVIDYLTSVDGQLPIAENAQDAPANLEVLGSDAFQNAAWTDKDINLSTFEESAGMVFAPPLVPEWNQIQAIFDANLGPFFLNEVDAVTTVEAIQAELEALLAE